MQTIYLLLGKEQGLKEQFLANVIKTIKKNFPKLEVKKIFMSDISVVELVETLSLSSFFSTYEIIVFYESELLRQKKEQDLVYSHFLKTCNKTIVFITDENSLNFSFQYNREVLKKIFYELSPKEKFSFIKKSFFELDCKIADEALELMLVLLNSDTKTLQFVIRSFSLLIKEKNIKKIEEHHVREWLVCVKSENSFSLFESMLKKDLENSLVKIKTILEQGEDLILVISSLIWQFKRLIKIHLDIQESNNLSEALRKNKIFYLLERTYKMGLENYTLDKLKQILKILISFDLYIRIYNKNMYLTLSYLLIYIIISGKGLFLKSFKNKLLCGTCFS